MAPRSAVAAKHAVPLKTGRASSRPRPAPNAACAIAARLETSLSASDRLLAAMSAGSRDFILSSIDGRVSTRVRLSVTDVSMTEHRTSAGRIVVDWSRAIVTNRDERVSLSRTELRLLAALVEGEGNVLTRSQLIARVWPDNQLPAADRVNALGVYICSLRKRLKVIGISSALQTVRRVGYRVAF